MEQEEEKEGGLPGMQDQRQGGPLEGCTESE